jgi:hypothetical protein
MKEWREEDWGKKMSKRWRKNGKLAKKPCTISPSPTFVQAMKFVLVTGGNASGCGKGCAAANIGVLLQAQELCVAVCKIEPYLVSDRESLRLRNLT